MTTPMRSYSTEIRSGALSGARKGWSSFLWICTVIVPVSFVVALLQWSGWLEHAQSVLEPVMSWLGLPGEAALPILSGLVINIYAAIAIMTVLPFSLGQMTLIAVFILIAHNLILEGIIQHRSGINVVMITVVRITAAVVTVVAISPFFHDTEQAVAATASLAAGTSVLAATGDWALDILVLLAKILVIIMAIMVLLECLTRLGWTEHLSRYAGPVMKLLGLSDRSAMLWVTAVVFGLMYGGAVIQERARQGDLTREELRHLQVSMGINHSMVEDPALFLALGINGFWLWVPKLVTAVAAVHAVKGIGYLVNRLARRQEHTT